MPNAGDAPPNAPPLPVAAPNTPALAPALVPTPSPTPSLPSVDSTVKAITGPLDRPHVQGLRIVYGGELTLNADQADGDLSPLVPGLPGRNERYTLSGHVRIHETDTTLNAALVTFDGVAGEADAADVLLNQKALTVRSKSLRAAPQRLAVPPGGKVVYLLTATEGDITTVPPGEKADYRIHAQRITLDEGKKRGVLYNATLYLFGTRLLTIPRIFFRLGSGGGAGRRTGALPTFGVSSRYGTYLAFGSSLRVGNAPVQYRLLLPTRQSVEAAVTSQQTLYAPPAYAPPARVAPAPHTRPLTFLERLRAAATAPVPVLPEGDPLRFHDFLPEPNPIRLFDSPARGGLGLAEELSSHVAAQGRLRDDLYVSRVPEVTLRGQVLLTRLPAPPLYGDPQAFRAALRHLVFYADAQETVGEYREQPTNINARRVRLQFGFSAHPLLVAPNTVFQPRVSVSTSGYSGSKRAYRYNQLALAANHYFSDLTAVGVQFLASTTSGDSPFNFDVLDTSRELDVRLQTGSRQLITAGQVRYDLSRHSVIDYQIAVAPALGGFTPVFSYNFRTRTLGLGAEIKGITF